MQNIQAILFDLFGTLVDYTPQVEGKDFSNTYSLLIKALDCDFPYADFIENISSIFKKLNMDTHHTETEFSMDEVFMELLSTYGVTNIEPEKLDQIVSQYCQEWKKYVSWNSDLQNLLLDLKQKYKIGVITNTHNSKMVFNLLEEIGILNLFDVVTTSVDFGKRKPNKNIFLETCSKINVLPTNCVFVGDSFEMDVQGSQSIGMLPIHISNEQNNSYHSISSILELRTIGLI